MKSIILFLMLIINSLWTIAQKPDTLYFNKRYNPVPESKAAYMEITSVNDDIETIRLIDLNKKTETVKHYKKDKPIGKWIVASGVGLLEYDFDKLVYLTDDQLKKEVQRVNGDITENTPGFIEPAFVGGDQARIKFLNESIVYPRIALENGYQGTVYLCFIVTSEGNIENVSVTKGANVYIDCEAVRAVRTMPKWNPATLNGKPVDFIYFMPVKFTLVG